MMQKRPMPVAYCWNYGREMSRKDIQRIGCLDESKQSQNPGHICKHLQFYGDQVKEGEAIRLVSTPKPKAFKKVKEAACQPEPLTMQELYNTISATLEQHGVRLEGSRLCLVQDMPNGGRMKLRLDEAEKQRKQA